MRKLLLDVFEEATTRGIEVGVGDRIKQARQEAGLTQDELADLIGVGMRQVQYYEAEESDPYRKLSKIAEVTGRTVGWLLHGEETTPQAADDLRQEMARLAEFQQELLRRFDDLERRLQDEAEDSP